MTEVDTRYDYVIVGAGSAGCVLAARLSEDPDVSVALLEAGPEDTVREIRIPALVSGPVQAKRGLGSAERARAGTRPPAAVLTTWANTWRFELDQRDDLHPRQPEDQLGRFGIEIREALRVGCGLQDHCMVQLNYALAPGFRPLTFSHGSSTHLQAAAPRSPARSRPAARG